MVVTVGATSPWAACDTNLATHAPQASAVLHPTTDLLLCTQVQTQTTSRPATYGTSAIKSTWHIHQACCWQAAEAAEFEPESTSSISYPCSACDDTTTSAGSSHAVTERSCNHKFCSPCYAKYAWLRHPWHAHSAALLLLTRWHLQAHHHALCRQQCLPAAAHISATCCRFTAAANSARLNTPLCASSCQYAFCTTDQQLYKCQVKAAPSTAKRNFTRTHEAWTQGQHM